MVTPEQPARHPAIFLDRDGVIIENQPHYVRSWADVILFPQALAALSSISNTPYKIVIVTNQAGIGRGLISPAVAHEINTRLIGEVERAGGRIDAIYLCPHTPEDACSCRKPLPGLLHRAAEQLGLDLGRSILIGDAISDLKSGLAAGIKKVALVRTGRGAEQERHPEAALLPPFPVYETLAEALDGLYP